MITRDDPPSVEIYVYIIFPLLFIGCYIMLAYYAEPNLPYSYYIPLFMGYFFSFGILLLVPIDIAACIYDRRYTGIIIIKHRHHLGCVIVSYQTTIIFVLFLLDLQIYWD